MRPVEPANLSCPTHKQPWGTIYRDGSVEYDCGCSAPAPVAETRRPVGSPEKCKTCGSDDPLVVMKMDLSTESGLRRCPDSFHNTPTPPAPADDARARVDEDGCCVGCGRSVQPSPCCPDYPADDASGAEAMREACVKACRDRSRSLYDGKQMAAGLEASKCADMIDALPLPATDDASGAEAIRFRMERIAAERKLLASPPASP